LEAKGRTTVWIGAGMYYLPSALALSREEGGKPGSPIAYRAMKRGTVIVSGGVVLNDWRPVTDPVVLRLIDASAKGKVVWTEIAPGLMSEVPGFANGGCGYRGKREFPIALYQDDRRLPVSRWPNEGFVKMGECVGKSVNWGRGIKFVDGVFRFDDRRLRRWVGEPDLWLDGLWYWAWADQKMALKAIDPKAKTIALANPESHHFGFRKGQDFYVFNAIGEIERPGEWAVDRAQRRVYLWPAADPEAKPVVVARHANLVKADGVEHVRFEDLVFESSLVTAISIRNSAAVTVSGSTVRHTGSWGVDINGGRDCTIIGCDLYDLGEGGIKARGGVRNTLTPGNHLIENNHIHHFGEFVNTYRPGAAVYGVGNKVWHNLIYQAQHQAISFRGNDHLIEYNIVHDVCLHSSDAGALYACTRDWSQRGTVIRHNLLHALGKGVDASGCRAIYLDDMTSGTRVESNIVTMSDCGLNFGGGKDNVVESNIALNCVRSINLASRGIDSFAKVDAAKGRGSARYRMLLREEELFRTELWRTRYPRLLAPLSNPDPIDAQNAHGNTLRDNVNVGGGKLSVRNAKKVMRTCTVEDNINLYEEPGFVDLAGFDLRLRDDSEIRKRIPGFKAPDFARMGLYDDPRRASPAIKFGPEVTPMPEIQPRIPRPELKPRYILERLNGKPFEADGVAGPKEWPKTRKPQLECVNKIYKAPSKSMCKARIGFDGNRLRFLVTVDVAPSKPLKLDGRWGGRDGLELALGDTSEDAPVFLVHAYPDGTFNVSSPGAVTADLLTALTEAMAYGAKAEKGKWTAELAIPLAGLGIELGAFRQIRFNMNVRRTGDNTWTCWWPPERGIADLESVGLLVLPRVLPETDEMDRRQEAARPLFDAEKKGNLSWRLLKDWRQTADPDRLGPAAQPADAPQVSFANYSGWAVARRTFRLTAEQVAQPFCALFLPCIDEEGEVYINGKLAASHTAKATGIAPGLLWRDPVLVDLKKTEAKPGNVKAAVHLRGNMGTGGLRKHAFFVWGKTVPTAKQLYDFLAENPKLSWRERVPAFWQDFERERIPALPSVPDEATFGKRIQRTMDLLATSTAEKRNRVRLLFYGQSITQGMHSREMINVLRSRFPWAIIDFENRAIGGFGASTLVRTGEHDLYPRDVDLLIFHVYGDAKCLDTIFSNVRRRNSSDILVYTHHYNWVCAPDKLESTLHRLGKSVEDWHKLAEKYQMELAPVWRDWPLFFRKHDWGINEVMGDTVHSNVHHNPAGHTLLAKLVLRSFRHHPGNPVTFPDAVRAVDLAGSAVETTDAWQRDEAGLHAVEKGARLKLTFDGNRVDVLPSPCPAPGSTTILVDGKRPSEIPELYYCSLPSKGPYIWMPALKRVSLGEGVLPRPETWTLTPFDVDLVKKTLSYRLEGSLTGPDGTGSKAADFVSNSGRIKIEAKDFHIIWPCTYRKKDRLPEGDKGTWEVRPLFVNPWRPAANADPAAMLPVTLVKGLSNGRHTLEIIANGDGPVGISGLVVRQPPLRE